MPQTTITVSSVAGGGSKTQDETGIVDQVLITHVKVTPSAAGDSYQVQLFGDDAYTATKKYYDTGTVTASPTVDPIQNDDGTITTFDSPNGLVAIYQDEDASGEFHVKVTNNSASTLNFTVVIDWVDLSGSLATNEKTIASGAITATRQFMTLDTEADAATDDLDTINGGYESMRIVLASITAARVPTVKDGTGNLFLAGDFAMDSSADTIELIKRGASWYEISRSNNV